MKSIIFSVLFLLSTLSMLGQTNLQIIKSDNSTVVYDLLSSEIRFTEAGDMKLKEGASAEVLYTYGSIREIRFSQDLFISTVGTENLLATAVSIKSEITGIGSNAVVKRGVIFDTNHNLTILNSPKVEEIGNFGTGFFSTQLLGLKPNTTYYARSYATNTKGTSYGNEISFTTSQISVFVTAVKASQNKAGLTIGATKQIAVTVLPTNSSDKNISWKSNNENVATVSQSGLITAVSIGATMLVVSSRDANFKDSVYVSVYNSNSFSVANVLNDNMVLQQDMQVKLWGWGPPNSTIQITASWNKSTNAVVDSLGKWKTTILTPKAVIGTNQPKYSIEFKAQNKTITFANILIGDVWLCSGQSNMVMPLQPGYGGAFKGVLNYQAEIAAANYPNLRVMTVPDNSARSFDVAENTTGTWKECNPANAANFSATAYYFGKELCSNPDINIPIGVIVSALSATYCQSWISREGYSLDTSLKTNYLDPFDASPTIDNKSATIQYNTFIAPLQNFSLKGFLWYQAEGNSNGANGDSHYTKMLTTLITDWRKKWEQGEVPFYYVQLPAYAGFGRIIKEQQINALTVPNTGMAVITELITDENGTVDLLNIHPRNKAQVGKRLALWAEAKTYNQNIVFCGPFYKSMTVEGNKIRIKFQTATTGTGLTTRDGAALNCFRIAASDNIYANANAVFEGNDILVSSPSVSVPAHVEFACQPSDLPNLMNKEGLTACLFKTDTWNFNVVISPTISNLFSIKNNNDDIIIYTDMRNHKLKFRYTNSLKDFSIMIVDMSGKLVLSSQLNSLDNESEIDTSKVLKGCYVVKITGRNFCLRRKILI